MTLLYYKCSPTSCVATLYLYTSLQELDSDYSILIIRVAVIEYSISDVFPSSFQASDQSFTQRTPICLTFHQSSSALSCCLEPFLSCICIRMVDIVGALEPRVIQ